MDLTFKTIFMALVTLPLIVASGKASNQTQAKCPSWNIFVFVQEWPPSICSVDKCKKIPSVVNGWTIHGLWSNKKDDVCDMDFCNNSWAFDWNKVKVLKPELESRWASLLVRDKPESVFWKGEWMKHGTCAASVPATRGQFRYFRKGLDLNARFNITRVFEEMKIFPSCKRPINVCTIQKAVRSYFKLPYYPPVKSFKQVHGKRKLIKSINICMRKDFTIDTCQTKPTKCMSDVYMYMYPFNTNCT